MTLGPRLTWHAQGGALVRKGRSTKTPAPPPPAPSARFPGDVGFNSTNVLFGAAVGSNGDVSPLESGSGKILALHRRYYSASSDVSVPNGSLFTAVRGDHTAGRVPWVSWKVATSSWGSAGSGGYDSTFDAIIAELNSYSHATWFTLNHEPENDSGVAADWRSMQSRFRARISAWKTANPSSTNRIAFLSCLMSYTWNPTSGRTPDDWWAGANVHDAVACDHYTEASQGITRSNPWGNFVTWCQGKPTPYAVGEWGVRKEDTSNTTKMQTFYDQAVDGSHDCVGLAYFDSDANSTGTGWSFNTAMSTKFYSNMQDARSVHASDIGA